MQNGVAPGAELSTTESCLPDDLTYKEEDRVKLAKEEKNLFNRLYDKYHPHNPETLFIPLIQTSGSKKLEFLELTFSDYPILWDHSTIWKCLHVCGNYWWIRPVCWFMQQEYS